MYAEPPLSLSVPICMWLVAATPLVSSLKFLHIRYFVLRMFHNLYTSSTVVPNILLSPAPILRQVMRSFLAPRYLNRHTALPLRQTTASLSRFYSSPTNQKRPPPGGQGTQLSFLPFLGLFFLSTGTYIFLVKRRTGQQVNDTRRKAHNES